MKFSHAPVLRLITTLYLDLLNHVRFTRAHCSSFSRSLWKSRVASLHVTHHPLLTGEDKVQHSTFPCGFLYHLIEELIISTFQQSLWFLESCYVVLPTDNGMVEVPHENHVLWTWSSVYRGSHTLSSGQLIKIGKICIKTSKIHLIFIF